MKVLHAPMNIAGQASILANAQRELGIEADVLIFNQHQFSYHFDINLSLSEKSTVSRYTTIINNFIKCFLKYDIFHFHFGGSLLPYNLDLPLLKFFKKKIIMHYWGSDIRQYSIAKNYLFFNNLSELQTICSFKDEDPIRKKIGRIAKYCDTTIVGDYSLLPYSPKSLVVKQAIDLKKFPYIGNDSKNKEVIIVHAPSDTDKKGTKYVISTIEKLKNENCSIEFILIINKTNDEALEIYGKADIIIDQLYSESHGIFAIECMALGKPVLCRIHEEFTNCYNGLPILNTDPNNLYNNLKLLIENKELRLELGKKGRKYVEEVHDSKKIAKKFIELYESI
jgi:glycosyltransferase involved in cell wall biosynthesis